MKNDTAVACSKTVYTKTSWYKKSSIQKYLFVYTIIVPTFFVYLVLGLFPNALSAYYSLLQWDGLTEKVFVGLDNYKALFEDADLLTYAMNNLKLILLVPVLVILISLILADVLVNRVLKENKIYKVLYFIPNVLSSVVIALMWSFIYSGDFGVLNPFLKLFGIDMGRFYWLGDERTSLWAVIPVLIWGSVGFYVIIFMNAISSIPKSYYEYATLEGAGSFVRLFKITLPLISGITKVSTLFLVLGVFKEFSTIMVLTGGGPFGSSTTIGLYMFGLAFPLQYGSAASSTHAYGYASTIGMVMFVILVGTKFLIDKFFSNDQIEF